MNINENFIIEEPDPDDLKALDFIPYQIYQRANYFDTVDVSTFRKRFRLSKESVQNILVQIQQHFDMLYSTGRHLDSTHDFAGMHTTTMSRIISRVSEAIAQLENNFIRFPDDTDTICRTKQTFYDIADFPQVIGAIDCSHFKIISPGENDPEIYRNRKGYFSVNAQFITDANLKILNIVAR